jgi:hypothetical protein
MIRWYADNSELRGIWGAEIPDILLFGGIVADDGARNEICAVMKEIKSAYHENPTFPLKWNFKDLERHYRDLELDSLYSRLLRASRAWRSEFFNRLSRIDFKIIISTIISYGSSRETLLRTREQVSRFAFIMALQRVGLCVRNRGIGPTEIVLDWPAGGQKNLFDLEYRSAHQKGTTADYAQGYDCGPLMNLGFGESALFASTNECSILQASDLIVGATRETIEEALGKREDSLGASLLSLIKEKFDGAPDHILGWGLPISPRQGEFFEKVRNRILAL